MDGSTIIFVFGAFCGGVMIGVVIGILMYDKNFQSYQWLRRQHWSCKTLCVVSADSVSLGTYCPTEERLDQLIDAAMKAKKETNDVKQA